MKLIEYLIREHNLEIEKAKRLIMAGQVYVNYIQVIFANEILKPKDIVTLKLSKEWVSRGALKLLEAIYKFKINIENKTCLDIGSSTGGFTQVLLAHGAKKVYAVDSGYNQLDYKIRSNPNVVDMEKTNVKDLSSKLFKEKMEIVVADVSFISLKSVFNVIYNLISKEADVIVLIKPEFEASSNKVKKGGFVPKEEHKNINDALIKYANEKGFKNRGIIVSPILGKKSKNIEYLAWFKPI